MCLSRKLSHHYQRHRPSKDHVAGRRGIYGARPFVPPAPPCAAVEHLEPLFLAEERAKLAVLEVLRSLNCHFPFFFLFTQTSARTWDLRT